MQNLLFTMRTKTHWCLGLITGLTFVIFFMTLKRCKARPGNVSQILASHAEAMGGKGHWASLKSYRKVIHKTNGLTLTISARLPSQISLHFQKANWHMRKVYDGTHGYIVRKGVYEAMRPGETIEMAEEAMYYSELMFAEELGYHVQLHGSETIDHTTCWKLSMRKSDTDEQFYWLNAKTFLIEQTGEYSEDPAHDGIFYKTRWANYRSVDGYLFPFRQSLIANDGDAVVSTVSQIDVNVDLASDDFVYQPDNTENLIRYWRDRYQNDRLRAFTFVQETIRFEEGRARDTTTWYEAVQYPNRFRIDFGERTRQNRNLYRNDSIYVLRDGELVHRGPKIQEFMIMEGSLYDFPVDTTLTKLRSVGVDVDRFSRIQYKGRDTYIIGSDEGDRNAPQIWMDAERRYTVRRFNRSKNGALIEVRYDDFQWINGHWVESWLEFYIDGKLIQTERYNNIRTQVALDPAIFDPRAFRNSYWY